MLTGRTTTSTRVNDCGLITSITTDLASFARLASEWDALLDQSDARRYFLRHHWTLAWWQHYAPPAARLFIITCRQPNGQLVGVAPLYENETPVLGVASMRELRFIGTGVETKTSEYLDFITLRGQERQVCEALWRHLAVSPQWDRMWLYQVPAGSPNLPYTPHLPGDVVTRPCDRAPYVDTSTDWDGYKQSLGRSMRRNVEYYPRRLSKQHVCEFELANTPDQVDESLGALVRLHQSRWNSRGEAGAFKCKSLEPFLRQTAHAGLAAGHTKLWTMRIDGQIEAVLIGFLDDGVLHYFQKGFNPAFSKHELGNVMVSSCIRACCEDPAIRAFDFMGGGAPYKQLWGRHTNESLLIEVQRSNQRVALFEAQNKLQERAVNFLRKVTPTPVREARRQFLKRRLMSR